MNKKFTKKDLVDVLVEKHDLTKKEVTELTNEVFDEIADRLAKGYDVDIPGFGKFVVKERKARTGINPATGAHINIPASKAPGFKPAKSLKEQVK